MGGKHPATAAAIRAAYGGRLTAADYNSLVNLRSIQEVVTYLKETYGYRELLAGLEPAYTNRGYLEVLLNRHIFTQSLRFCKMEHLENTPFFRFFIYEYELRELLKKLQRMSQANEDYVAAMDTYLAPYSAISLEQLARAQNRADLLKTVAQTPYRAVLEKHLKPDGIPADHAACETALRATMLQRVQKEAQQTLKGSDLDALTELLGEQADLINLINAYRLKRAFHANADTVRALMLPVEGRLPRRISEQLVEAPTVAAFLEILSGTRYGRLLERLPAADLPEPVWLEQAFQTLRYRAARRALHFSGHAAVSLYAAQVLRQIEVRNLIIIIEGIRYGRTPAYLQQRLIYED